MLTLVWYITDTMEMFAAKELKPYPTISQLKQTKKKKKDKCLHMIQQMSPACPSSQLKT